METVTNDAKNAASTPTTVPTYVITSIRKLGCSRPEIIARVAGSARETMNMYVPNMSTPSTTAKIGVGMSIALVSSSVKHTYNHRLKTAMRAKGTLTTVIFIAIGCAHFLYDLYLLYPI